MSRKEKKIKQKIINLEKGLIKTETDSLKTLDSVKKLLWANEDLYKLNPNLTNIKKNVDVLYKYFNYNSINYSVNKLKQDYSFFSNN